MGCQTSSKHVKRVADINPLKKQHLVSRYNVLRSSYYFRIIKNVCETVTIPIQFKVILRKFNTVA